MDGATWTYTLAGAIESTSTLGTHPVEENEFNVTTTSVDGTSWQTGHCTEEGIAFWDEAGLTALFQSGAGTSTASTLQSTGISLPHEIEPGDTWSQAISVVGSDTDGIVSVNAEFEAQGYETISVVAGDFDTLRILRISTVLFQGNEIREETTEWYAKDVGLVKRVTSITGMPELPLGACFIRYSRQLIVLGRKMMKKILALSLVFTVIAAGCGTPEDFGTSKVNVTENPATEVPPQPAPVSGDECGNPYYPLKSGAQWSYNGPTGPFTHTILSSGGGVFAINVESGADTFVIQALCMEGGDINLLQVPGTSLSYSGQGGGSTMTTTSNEGITLPGDIQQGDDWSQTIGVKVSAGDQTMDFIIDSTYTAVGYENVTVPAGTFNALKIEQSTSMGGPEPTMQTLWYVQDVGLVKSVIEVGEIYVNELVSYNIP